VDTRLVILIAASALLLLSIIYFIGSVIGSRRARSMQAYAPPVVWSPSSDVADVAVDLPATGPMLDVHDEPPDPPQPLPDPLEPPPLADDLDARLAELAPAAIQPASEVEAPPQRDAVLLEDVPLEAVPPEPDGPALAPLPEWHEVEGVLPAVPEPADREEPGPAPALQIPTREPVDEPPVDLLPEPPGDAPIPVPPSTAPAWEPAAVVQETSAGLPASDPRALSEGPARPAAVIRDPLGAPEVFEPPVPEVPPAPVAPPEYRMVAPVELRFTDGPRRIGIRPGTATFLKYQRLAAVLLGDLRKARADGS
jgi:hypothetical protein